MLRILALLLVLAISTFAQSPLIFSNDGQDQFLGTLNSNRFDPDSVSNPLGVYGSPFSPKSVNNQFGEYGSLFSPYSANNPHATQAPKIVTPYGAYLGTLSTNPYAPDSTSNRFGRHGSPFSPTSITNPYSPYRPWSSSPSLGTGVWTPRMVPVAPTVPAIRGRK